MAEKTELIPPDLKQCQAMKPNGHTFMSFGGIPGRIRCEEKPTVIITEKEQQGDGKKGSMSLCVECLEQAQRQLGDTFIIKAIK